MTRPATLRTPGGGRTVAVVGDVDRFLATGEDTDGTYARWEAVVPPGGGPPHVHSREDERLYVLDGEVTFAVNGERGVATAGTFAAMPAGTPHGFRNESDRPARMRITVAPAGLERLSFEVGVPLAAGARAAPPPTPDDVERLLAAPRYGIQIRLPPHGSTPRPEPETPPCRNHPTSRGTSPPRNTSATSSSACRTA